MKKDIKVKPVKFQNTSVGNLWDIEEDGKIYRCSYLDNILIINDRNKNRPAPKKFERAINEFDRSLEGWSNIILRR